MSRSYADLLDEDTVRLLRHLVVVGIVVALIPIALTAMPSLFGADRVITAGDSAQGMAPILQEHSLVFVDRPAPETIERGEVIMYERDGTTQFTRVALVTSVNEEPAYVVSTENQARPETDPVLASELRWRRVMTMPYFGAVIGGLRATPVLGLVLHMQLGIAVYELLAWGLLIGIVVFETSDLLERIEQSLTDATGTGIALTRADLTGTTLALGALAVFAIGVLLQAASPITLTLAIFSVGLFGYSAFLWSQAPEPTGQPSETLDIVHGSLAGTVDGRTQVSVDSAHALAGMARANHHPVAVDEDADACFLAHGDVVYVCHQGADALTNGV